MALEILETFLILLEYRKKDKTKMPSAAEMARVVNRKELFNHSPNPGQVLHNILENVSNISHIPENRGGPSFSSSSSKETSSSSSAEIWYSRGRHARCWSMPEAVCHAYSFGCLKIQFLHVGALVCSSL